MKRWVDLTSIHFLAVEERNLYSIWNQAPAIQSEANHFNPPTLLNHVTISTRPAILETFRYQVRDKIWLLGKCQV
jgi:hypothetical protein